MEESVRRALKSISTFGDTDIFPFPFERHIFHDRPDDSALVLMEIHKDFQAALAANRPANIETLVPVGYTGFRWATQIEPFWNAYYLALVLQLSEKIEAARIPVAEAAVFSYRFSWDEERGSIFANSNWRDFKRKSAEQAKESKYVVVADIADFYSRIYHHRLENALRRLPDGGDIPRRIMDFLQVCSKNDSYGLPVGGPASRILAELALADVDSHLRAKRIRFCRYADDYAIFADSREEAYRHLVFLADKLFNEGLALQKKKTRVVTSEEFLETAVGLNPDLAAGEVRTDEDKLLSISVRFDPYSPTAVDDYEKLKAALKHIDIVGILGREVAKASIDQAVTRQAIAAVAALGEKEKEGAIRTLLDIENIYVLAPVFISVLRLVREIYDSLPENAKDHCDQFLVSLHEQSSYLLSMEVHCAYYVQALSRRPSAAKEHVLVAMYEKSNSPMVRRQIILAMIEMNGLYWLRDIKGEYNGAGEWEKRSLILASYWLGDEGKHWRSHLSRGFSRAQLLVRDWFAQRWQANRTVPH